jgi:hypothetical protein
MHEEVYDCGTQPLNFNVDLDCPNVALREPDLREYIMELANLTLKSFFNFRLIVERLREKTVRAELLKYLYSSYLYQEHT